MFKVTVEKVQKWAQKGETVKLIQASKNLDPAIRLAAVKAMGSIDNEHVVNALIVSLRDREPEIRMTVIDSLVKLKKKMAVEHIRSLISDSNPEVSEKARESLKLF